MYSLFKKEKENKTDENHLSLTSVAALLVHSAKIDQNFTEKEKDIIKRALIEMGADENNIDMGSAVQINDPISTLGLKIPLMVEVGTNMKNALDLLQRKEQNCILIVENNVLKGILTERDILLKII